MWQRSCLLPRHNMGSRGERELRGERRGKGGRSLLATAAPFFFICLSSTGAWGQRIDVYGRVGMGGSTPLVRDQVVSAQMAELLGAAVNDEVRAVPKIAPTFGAGVRAGFWPRVAMVLDAEWSPTELEARDSGTRPIQDMDILKATVGAQWAAHPLAELGAGVGMLWYRSEGKGLFDGGSNAAALLEGTAAWTPPYWNNRLALIGTVSTHRFGNRVIREAGGSDGSVTRFGMAVRVRLAEKSR